MKKRWLLVALVAATIILAACTPKECTSSAQCSKKGHTAQCVKNNCVYTPIPGACGNTKCEADVNENRCSCPDDCKPACKGPVEIPGTTTKTKYLAYVCDEANNCLQGVDPALTKPILEDAVATGTGAKFKISSIFNQPFNLKRDTFSVTVQLDTLGAGNSDVTITKLDLTGVTSDKRTVTIANKQILRKLFQPGDSATEQLRVNFPGEIEGTLTQLALTGSFSYTATSGAARTQRTGTFRIPYKTTFTYVIPTTTYACPNCDDGNPATQDTCGPQTDFFCEHTPISGACGNSICEGNENKCSCAQDCGPCIGSAGKYMTYFCQNNQCLTQMQSVTAEPKTIFDDRDTALFHLQNRFSFNTPFNVKVDTLNVEFRMTEKRDDVDFVRLLNARVLSRNQEIGYTKIGKSLAGTTSVVNIAIPITIKPTTEEDHTPNVIITYDVQRGEKTEQASFTKQLDKITFVNPDVMLANVK